MELSYSQYECGVTPFVCLEEWRPPQAPAAISRAEPSEPPGLNGAQFEDAFRKGYKATIRFLLSLGTRTETAEEVAQAAWARGWEYRWQLQRPERVGTWVNSIAKNILRSDLRAKQRLESLEDVTPIDSPILLEAEAKRILLWCQQQDLNMLSDFYVEGYTAEEIAVQRGLTAGAVRARLFRIRQSLRSQFLNPVTA